MSIIDGIAKAKEDNWLISSVSADELKRIKLLARVSAYIEQTRLERNYTQKEFAKMMGVSQGMVSKWESGEYNFSIETLTVLFEKLDLQIDFVIKDNRFNYDSNVIHFEQIKKTPDVTMKNIKIVYSKEGIA